MGKSCCGFGHREMACDICNEIIEVLEKLIVNENADTFYTGGMG